MPHGYNLGVINSLSGGYACHTCSEKRCSIKWFRNFPQIILGTYGNRPMVIDTSKWGT